MISIVRPVNLLLLALTQSVIYFLFIEPLRSYESIQLQLDRLEFFILLLVGLILAATGYIINDYFDHDLDSEFKSKYQLETKENYLKIYFPLVIIGFSFSIALAIMYGHPILCLLYPLTALLLFLYSSHLKSIPLLGNILISLFTALSIGILVLAEWPSFRQLSEIENESYKPLIHIFSGFLGFSFFINLAREIIKDIEDHQGDKVHQVNSFAVKYGIERSKKLVYQILITLLILILIWIYLWPLSDNVFNTILAFLLLLFPQVLLLVKTRKARTQNEFKYLSSMSKINMILAILFLIIVQC